MSGSKLVLSKEVSDNDPSFAISWRTSDPTSAAYSRGKIVDVQGEPSNQNWHPVSLKSLKLAAQLLPMRVPLTFPICCIDKMEKQLKRLRRHHQLLDAWMFG
jgi:hypothetical protein